MSSLVAKLTAKRRGETPREANDTERAVAVRRVRYDDQPVDLTDELKQPWGEMSLLPLQSAALHAIREAGGGLFPLCVGSGKSGIAILAGTVLAAKRVLLLVPATLVQKTENDLGEWRKHFRIVPIRIMSYELLSRREQAEELERFRPDLVVCDETHRLRYVDRSRTFRLITYFNDHPETKYVGLSGTITSRSLTDFSHLMELALRDQSPMPLDKRHLEAWAECIDVGGRPADHQWRVVQPLIDTFAPSKVKRVGKARIEQVRAAWSRRLRSAPGVVCSTSQSFDGSLVIREIEIPVPPRIEELLERSKLDKERADGEVLTDDAAQWRNSTQLSCGFWLRWDWPNDVVDEAWMEARLRWDRFVRAELEANRRRGYDSKSLVEEAAERGELGTLLTRAWAAWKVQKHKKKPPTVPEWESDFIVRDVVERMKKTKHRTWVWYESPELGMALERAGLSVVYAGQDPPKKGEKAVCLSTLSHAEGFNIQDRAHNLIVQPPGRGSHWEQLLGRTHRQGQKADEVVVEVYSHTEVLRERLEKMRKDPPYLETTNPQKLTNATWVTS